MNLKIKKQFRNHKPAVHGGLNSIMGADILDFSSNVNPMGAPKEVTRILRRNLDSVSSYPDIDSTELEKSLSKYTGVPTSKIAVGNGATELIYNFCQAFLSEKTPVLLPIPTFEEYKTASLLHNCCVDFFKTMNLENNLKDFVKHIPKNGCVFVCNPNNPTGNLVSKESISKIIIHSAKKNSLVFLDECFIEMTPGKNESAVSLIKKFDNLFVLRSLTKSFGLAGIRIGYGLGNSKLISILKKIKIPWSVNSLAQLAGTTALKNVSHLEKSKLLIQKESAYLQKKISMIKGFDCYDTSTNFILINTKINSTILQKKLLHKKILVRDCKTFQGLNNHYIRIAVKTRKENNTLLKELMAL